MISTGSVVRVKWSDYGLLKRGAHSASWNEEKGVVVGPLKTASGQICAGDWVVQFLDLTKIWFPEVYLEEI